MEDKRKTLVLFDVGCVLVKLDYGSFYREAAKLAGESTPLAAEEFKQRYISSGIEEQINLDQMSGPEFLDKMSKMISGKPIDKSALCKAIDVCWHAQIDRIVELKKQLYQSGYAVGIFSNTSKVAWSGITKKFPGINETFEKSFPRIFSFDVHSLKPDPEMYQEINGYDNIILIDDKMSYLKTAVDDFGWSGIQYTEHPDPEEAMSSYTRQDAQKPKGKFRIAENVEEVYDSLREFGLELLEL